MKLIVYDPNGRELARWVNGKWNGDIDRLPDAPATDDIDIAANYVENIDGVEAKRVATVNLPDTDDWMRRGRRQKDGETDEEFDEAIAVEDMTEEEIRGEYEDAEQIIEALREEGVGVVSEQN